GGEREGGCVVDPVAGHRDHAAFGLQPLDDVGLVGGHHLRFDLVDTQVTGDGGGGRATVTGEHQDANAGGAKFRECRWRRAFDRVGDTYQSGGAVVDRNEDDGLRV